MNPYQSTESSNSTASKTTGLQRAGTWTLWISLLVLLLPVLLFGVGVVWQQFFWDPKTDPGNLEILMWSPILIFITTPIAVVGGIIGIVLRVIGKRKAAPA